MNALLTALKALAYAIPGVLAVVNAFKKKPEPSAQDVASKAAGEVAALESWKSAVKLESKR